MQTRVIVVDDEPLVRSGVAMLLGGYDDIAVIGEAADGEHALRLTTELQPDVVLMDLRMPGTDGIATILAMTADDFGPGDRPPRILALTTFNDEESVRDALRAGANGFLVKDNAPANLAAAVRSLAAGDCWLDPSIAAHVITALRDSPLPGGSPSTLLGRLTPREREILTRLASGRSNAQIAADLYLSEATVRTHISRILMKTGVGDRTKAVVLAYQSGLVQPAS